ALPHLGLHVVFLEEALEAEALRLGRGARVSVGLHGLRRGSLLPGPAARARGGVPRRAHRAARSRASPRAGQVLISVAYLDGRRLARAVIAGARFVSDRAEALNKINVFPVPDGDTGTNVASTLSKVASGIGRVRQRHMREMSRTLADEAVNG